jgi:hypothetical protein
MSDKSAAGKSRPGKPEPARGGGKGGGAKAASPKMDRESLAKQLLGTLSAETLDDVGYIRRSEHVLQITPQSRKVSTDLD